MFHQFLDRTEHLRNSFFLSLCHVRIIPRFSTALFLSFNLAAAFLFLFLFSFNHERRLGVVASASVVGEMVPITKKVRG